MSYRLTWGDDNPRIVETKDIIFYERGQTFLPGVYSVGYYAALGIPAFSFRYYKQDDEGAIEECERVILHTGFGRGVHPQHEGQESALYLVGMDVARLTRNTTDIHEWVVEESGVVVPKHFSTDCILNGVMGKDPVLANP